MDKLTSPELPPEVIEEMRLFIGALTEDLLNLQRLGRQMVTDIEVQARAELASHILLAIKEHFG